ncbi:MAG: glycosyltransferase [Methyloprofundus sp.]|nr:glycosyltransferase [Methyloprofundus sp.]
MIKNLQLAQWGIFPLWLFLTLSIFLRTPTPIDETRYLSVAWEMWLRQDFLVPHLNGETYSHKPPLLFWLIQLSWGVFGANEWSARLLGPICALLNLCLVRSLAKQLWPEQQKVALLAPWVLIATLLWTLFATATMFDILLGSCVLLGMQGLVNAAQGKSLKGWATLALAIGLGVLAKGPVVLVHLLPVALLMPLWLEKQQPVNYYRWYGFMMLAILAGAMIALAWAIPAAMQGGEAYAKAILWSQTADRTVTTRIHARPFWWYLPFLPLFIFPWLAWPRMWKSLLCMPWKTDWGIRFCSLWFISCLLIFSLIQSKQVHYLLPLLPASSLIIARLLANAEKPATLISELVLPICICFMGLFLLLMPSIPLFANMFWVQAMDYSWGGSVLFIALALLGVTLYLRQLSILAVSMSVVFAAVTGYFYFFKFTGSAYDLKPAAEKVKYLQEQGIAVAYLGPYHGQFHFLGRLTQPIEVVPYRHNYDWAGEHPDGYLISLEKQQGAHVSYMQRQRERWLIARTGRQTMQLLK